MIGTQLGGAIKNVIAIACGIVSGRQLGDSARAALLTRGIAEIARLGVAMGSQKDTLLGMCGIGDLMLTCSSMQSRNYSLGYALGEGESLEDILGARNAVTEGVHSAQSTLALAKKHAVDMPITEAVNKCLNEGMAIDDAIEEMLNRPFKYEMSRK
jgi:glycerol-3-phosphate dehydrogenase (NAD(P)+)